MSNAIDYDMIAPKVQTLFELAIQHVTEAQGKKEDSIKYNEYKIGTTGLSFADGELIHMANDITLYKNEDDRVYTIVQHYENEDSVSVARFNLSDDPSQKVRVIKPIDHEGSSATYLNNVLKTIDDSALLIKEDIKNTAELKAMINQSKKQTNISKPKTPKFK